MMPGSCLGAFLGVRGSLAMSSMKSLAGMFEASLMPGLLAGLMSLGALGCRTIRTMNTH
jgi:hypothetical protein